MTLHTTPSTAPTTANLDAARLLLARLGVSPADLLTAAPDRAPAPTFAEYTTVVRAAVSGRTRRVYGSYWIGSSSSGAPAPGRLCRDRPVCAVRREPGIRRG
jgi:hypothetical protein